MASQVQDAISKVDAIIAATVTGSTVVQKAVPPEKIRGDELPHFQLFGAERVPIERFPWRHTKYEITFTVVGHLKDVTKEELWTEFDAIKAAIDADETLTDTVNWCEIGASAIDEPPARDALGVIVFTVVAEVYD